MDIGILGTGNIGGTLARKLSTAGHQVRVANSRGVAGVRDFAADIGATAADARGAIEGAEVVFLSIPFIAVESLPSGLFDGLAAGTPIVDTGNYYPRLRDPQMPELDAGKVESVWVSEQLGRPVFKAYNNILAGSFARLGRPRGAPGRLAVAVAGDDPAGKRTVMDLVDQTGFEPLDSGSLADSWRQQPSNPGYCCDYDIEKMRKGILSAESGVAAPKRDAQVARMLSFPQDFGRPIAHEDILAMNLELNSVD